MIHPPKDDQSGYVISSRRVWLPGSYETEQAARYAFYLQNHQLQELEDRINKGEQRTITMSDLREVRRTLVEKEI